MGKRKYPPDPAIETIERLIKKRDELQAKVTSLEKLLRRLHDISIGLLIIDDEDPDGLWLERMLKAKKVMDEVSKELGDDRK